jgi:hypothetical protein
MKARRKGLEVSGRPDGSSPDVYESALLRQLAQGWPVRKVARTYGLTIADVKAAIGGREPARRQALRSR